MGFLSCAPVETTLQLADWHGVSLCPLSQSCHRHHRVLFFLWRCSLFAKGSPALQVQPDTHLHPFMAKSPVGSQEHGGLVGTFSPLEHSHHMALGASTCPRALSTQTRQGSGVLGASWEKGLGQHTWLEMFLLAGCPLVTATVTLSRLAPPPQATSSATQITLD